MADTELDISNIPTLPVSSDNLLVAGWILGLTDDDSLPVIINGNSGGISIYVTSTGGNTIWDIFGFDDSRNFLFEIYPITIIGLDLTNSEAHSYAFSVNTTTKIVQLLVDRALFTFDAGNSSSFWDHSGVIGFFPSVDNWTIGPVNGGGEVTLSDFRFGAGEGFFDLSVPANADKLFTVDNKPVDWGINGQSVTGLIPAVYLHGDDINYADNLGSGGPFIVTGSFILPSPLICEGAPPLPSPP